MQGERDATRVLAVVLAAGFALVTACTNPVPPSPPTLLRPGPGPDAMSVDIDAAVLESEPATIRLRVATGPIDARLDRVEHRGAGRLTWFGRTAGAPAPNVVITAADGAVAATVETATGTVAVTPAGPGRGRLRQVPTTALTARSERVVPAPAMAMATAAVPAALPADRWIDVMIVYGSAVTASYGEGAVAAIAQNAVDRTNLAFYASHIATQVRLAAVVEVDDGHLASLEALQQSQWVAALRAFSGSDLVQGWGADAPDFCGQGYQNQGGPIPDWGYSLVAAGCIPTVAPTHEWGHNLGAGHDHATDGPGKAGERAFPDSYGLVSHEGGFATIMAYDDAGCPGPCERVYYFSNPGLSVRGVPLGQAGYADNARAIRTLAPMVAGYKSPMTFG